MSHLSARPTPHDPDAFLDALRIAPARRPAPPRCLLLAAHPDDEVVGAGGQLPWLQPRLHVAHLTPGVPIALDAEQRLAYASLEEYGACREQERTSVLDAVGVLHAHRHRLDGVDQRCVARLVPLVSEFTDLLRRVRPDVVLTHAYEGGHPDHDCAALIAQVACARLAQAPARVEFASYHLRDGRFESGAFLPGGPPTIEGDVSAEALAFKRTLLAEYASQQAVLRQFDPRVERFRLAPTYDFSRPPHEPPLYYDGFPWGTNAFAFQRHAVEALAEFQQGTEPVCR